MNCVHYELPDGMESLNVFCPACGVQALTSEPEAYIDQPSCQHVKFLYVGLAGKFEYIVPNVQNQLSVLRRESQSDDFLSDYELLQQLLKDDRRILVIEISTSGMTCGPMSSTVSIGFDIFSEKVVT